MHAADHARISDSVSVEQGKGVLDRVTIRGRVVAEVYGPDGKLKQREVTHNLVTDVGDIYTAKKVSGTSVTALAGMKLGIGTTAASKNGAGSFIAASSDYVAGSAKAFDATFPKLGASNNIAQFKTSWAAGEGTNAAIKSVAITDNTTNAGEADATHTFSRAVFANPIDKGANDTLAVTWDVTYIGS